MTYYRDSSHFSSRLVYTHKPCDSLTLKDSSGKVLQTKKAGKTSDCYACSELASESNMAVIESFQFRESNFQYLVMLPETNLYIYSEICGKYVHDFLDRWPDTMSVVMWHEVDTVKGMLKFYFAEELYVYPYYNVKRMDSLVYNLEPFCTPKDIDAEKKQWHEAMDPHMKVLITPNPFRDEFELKLTYEESNLFLQREPITLTFADDMGNTYSTHVIATGKTYKFSFPDVAPGKTIYYHITWGEYKLGGQILKAN